MTTRPNRKITLEAWKAAIYGENSGPNMDTARRWARDGKIQPPAEKHGREYYVDPHARYVPFSAPQGNKPRPPAQRLIDKVKAQHGI